MYYIIQLIYPPEVPPSRHPMGVVKGLSWRRRQGDYADAGPVGYIMGVMKKVRHIAESTATHVERGLPVALVAFCLLYLTVTTVFAMCRLWYDELLTYYISRLPSLGAIWAALKDGADLNPPLLYIATRASQAVFGDTQIATRVPAMLGFLVMCLCLFRCVSRRCGICCGFAAMILPLLTGAYAFASEARPYGMLLGLCGLALVAWQSAAEGRPRKLALFTLMLSLSLALLTHCYAVFMLIPFGLGELVRTISRRRTDWPVWLCLAAPVLCVLSYFPLIGAMRQYTTLPGYFLRAKVSWIPEFYALFLGPALWPLLGAFLILTVASRGTSQRTPERGGEVETAVPIHEVACAVGFVLIPVVAVLLATALGGGFQPRYASVSVIGMGMLFGFLAFNRAGRASAPAGALIILFLGWFILDSGAWVAKLFRPSNPYELPSLQLSTLPQGVPIVISNGLLFLEADHYEPPKVASRLYFLTDRRAAIAYTRADLFDQAFYVQRKWFPIRGKIVAYDQFMSQHERFLVYGPYAYPDDWLIRRLLDEGVRISLKGQYSGPRGDTVLLEVQGKP